MYVSSRHNDWDDYLPFALYAYRTAMQESTRYAPFELLYGRQPRLPLEAMLEGTPERFDDEPDKYHAKVQKYLEHAHQAARSAIEVAQDRQERHYDEHHRRVQYDIGDLVMIHQPKRREGRIKKLQRPWRGPFQICGKVGPVTYEVKSLSGPQVSKDSFHVSKLKPYRKRRDLNAESAEFSEESESECEEDPDVSQDFVLDRDDPSQDGEDVTAGTVASLIRKDPTAPQPLTRGSVTSGAGAPTTPTAPQPLTRGRKPIGHKFPKRLWGK